MLPGFGLHQPFADSIISLRQDQQQQQLSSARTQFAAQVVL
jgi:hypothetical protein